MMFKSADFSPWIQAARWVVRRARRAVQRAGSVPSSFPKEGSAPLVSLLRSRIAVGLLPLLALGAMPTTAFAQKVIKIAVSPAKASPFGVAIDGFCKSLEEKAGQRYKCQTFYSGALGGDREILEGLQLGTIEMTFTSTGATTNFVPEIRIFDIPYLFRDYSHARAVLDGPIGRSYLEKFRTRGLVGLAWGDNGFRHLTNSKRPVASPQDAKGLKIRTQENPLHIQAFRAFGLNPTPMAFPELYGALQQGTVDGQENPISLILTSKFYQVQKHLSLTGHAYAPGILVAGQKFFDALPAADKALFMEAAKAGIAANRAQVDLDEKNGIAYLKEQGVAVVEKVDRAAFEAALKPAYATFEAQFGRDNIQKIKDVH